MENLNTIDSLRAEKRKLTDELRFDESAEKDLQKVRDIEEKIKNLQRVDLIKKVNARQQSLRVFAKMAWDCEQPTVDITNSDGSLHATKVKKYPFIASIKYLRATWKHDCLFEMTINGNKFSMFRTKYDNNKVIVSRPESFEEFLQMNSIMVNDITIDEYVELANKLDDINSRFNKMVKDFDKERDDLNLYANSVFGLIEHCSVGHIYTFKPKA